MIRTVEDLHGSAGQLEALLNEGTTGAAYAALVCHPHPPSGGTMHTKVVYRAAKAFSSFGIPVLRFNFRGVGLSKGSYSNGPGEIDDVRAAIDWLDRQFAIPVLLAGFSFGANVSWRAGCGDPRVAALIGLGMPLEAGGRSYSYEFLAGCTQPKLLITGTADQFAPRNLMEQIFADAPEPKEFHWIDGAEHFFMGVPGSQSPKLDRMQLALSTWLRTHFFPDASL